MQAILLFLIAVTGSDQTQSSGQAAANHTDRSAVQANSNSPAPAPTQDAKALKGAISDALRFAGGAKVKDRAVAIERLVTVFDRLGDSSILPRSEKQRLGAELRLRLTRYETQFRSEIAKSGRQSRSASQAEAQGGPSVEGLNDLVDVIQKTIGPNDWVLAQQRPGVGNQPGGFGAGFGGQQAGQQNGGNTFQQMTDANGQALADVIQDTIEPDSWDVRGGPGKIVYFGQFHALVVRQTGDVQDELGDLIGALRK